MRPFLCVLMLMTSALSGAEALRLPQVLSDGMVVQRNQPVRLWGWDRPGQEISATIRPGTRSGTAIAAADGTWRCELPALQEEGPYTITVQGSATRTIGDVLAGEVWLCAGQSNMHWSLAKSTGGAEAIATAEDPKLRLLVTPTAYADAPLTDAAVRWNHSTPLSARHFSGVAYHFGRSLRRELGVPVGLIQSAVGGSTAEAWTDRSWLRSQGEGGARFSIGIYDAGFTPEKKAAYWSDYASKYAQWAQDLGRSDAAPSTAAGWSAAEYADEAWKDFSFPGTYGGTTKGKAEGVGAVWFRRSIELPATLQGQDLSLYLGAIQQCDTCWWNGERIGGVGWETPYGPGSFRTYTIPAALVKARNVLAIRVWAGESQGGFTTEAEWTRIEPRRWTGEQVSLAGTWKMQVERSLPPLPPDAKAKPAHTKEYFGDQKTAGNLWDGMIAPYTPLPLAGVAWYQGESNSWLINHTMFHYDILPTLIRGWRSAFAREDLPFLLVQLPGKMKQDTWPEFRQSQAAALRLPGTGLVVTLDVGDRKEVHCPDKRPVGERLTALALQQVYGVKPVGRSPLLEDAMREGAAVRCRLRDAAGLRVRGGGAVGGVEIAGADGLWRKAQASVDGESLVVRCAEVPEPAGVRYAWVDWPDFPLLENGIGLPVGPFRRHLAPPVVIAATIDAKRAERVEVKLALCDRLRQVPAKGVPPGFTLAGADGVWKPAKSVIVSAAGLLVWNAEAVPAPVHVRYEPPAGAAIVLSTADGFSLPAFALPCSRAAKP